MAMSRLPDDPFRLAPSPATEIADQRRTTVFGAPVDVCLIPGRRTRQGRPGEGRPTILRRTVPRILAEETVWESEHVALTPNRHPFGLRQALLWSRSPRREADATLLEAAFEWADRCDGAILANSIGAAASIPWAHVHVVGQQNPFLPALALGPAALPDDFEPAPGCTVRSTLAPLHLLAITGPAPARAATTADLLERRSTAAFNLADQGGTSWLMPRGPVEAPAPEFPQAFGSAELWGRWCFDDERAYRAAGPEDLERAFLRSGYPEP